jgi:UDP-N-acetylglucosamine diphosphorylase/glucosamine-1-phosphate N-acetyltransferase
MRFGQVGPSRWILFLVRIKQESSVSIVPIIFEDHNLVRMRPLTWGQPVFELRCGIFSTRERIGMCRDRKSGVLLGRDFLQDLHTAAGWETSSAAVADPQWKDSRFLFVNGMLAPDFSLCRRLLELGPEVPDFAWRNGDGLVAALVDQSQAREVARDWAAWETSQSAAGAWSDPAAVPTEWGGDEALAGLADLAGALGGVHQELMDRQDRGPRWIWDIVPATAAALAGDLSFVRKGISFRREPFGVFPHPEQPGPDWLQESTLAGVADSLGETMTAQLVVDDPAAVFCGANVHLAPGTALATASGPIVLDRGVRVMPQCYLEGPLYIGPGSLVKPGTRIHGETSLGIVNRVAGEIAESTFGDFTNKQHEGFIGHAVLGSWVNLGAMTTCSDLKNNYGEIRVDLGAGTVATGRRFVGLMMGDHAKTAIGTLFNTGTCVGFASNIFGSGMPPKFVGNFLWGGQPGCPSYAVDRARATATMVMDRRGCRFSRAHADLFNTLA